MPLYKYSLIFDHMFYNIRTHCMIFFITTTPVVMHGCVSNPSVPSETITQAWGYRDQIQKRSATRYQPRPVITSSPAFPTASPRNDQPVAVVNGREISRSRLVDLILRSHGVGVLEQLIGLEAAIEMANTKGLSVDYSDINAEHDLALRRLTNPLASVTPQNLDRVEAERILDRVLAERNISREEWMIVLQRNAYLRKIVQSQQQITQQQLEEEYSRAYDESVQVRHIQLATMPDVGRVLDQLEAGTSFSDLAKKYSANQASAREGGLLTPFSIGDDRLPELFRMASFALEPGSISDAIRIGEWYHLIRLEKKIPPQQKNFQQVRDELETRLRNRITESEMFEHYEKIFKDATIEIYDPVLREAFELKHQYRKDPTK